METVKLGGSDLVVSRIGFGCCPMGGHGWGITHEGDFLDAVARALDCGVNFFDTADVYGLGRSETTLGRGIRGLDRKRVVVATKFGVRHEGGRTFHDTSPRWIRQAVEASLRRLGLERIDLYQMHAWDGKTPIEEVFDSLQVLRREGKIGWFGITNHPVPETPPEGLVSFSYEFSLTRRQHLAEIRRGATRGIGFISWGSLGQGILTGRYDRESRFAPEDRRSREVYENYHSGLDRSLETVARMRGLDLERPLPQIALRWILETVPRSVALAGIKRVDQLRENAGAMGWSLPPKALERLE